MMLDVQMSGCAAPTAQLRTSRHKKYVYVDGDTVRKGPYVPQEKALLLAERNLAMLQLLQEVCQIPNYLRTDLPFRKDMASELGRTYLVYENVGMPPKQTDAKRASTKIDRDVLVLGRGTFVQRVSDRERAGELTTQQAEAALQHLYFRYLMNVGDSGTHNILVRHQPSSDGQLVVGIDMEENRSGTPMNGTLGLLFKRPSKLQTIIYTPLLNQIALMPADLPVDVQRRLSVLGFEPDDILRRASDFRKHVAQDACCKVASL